MSCDIETYSDADLKKAGLYKYAESPAFSVLLFAYSLDGGPVRVIDLACGEAIPDDIMDAMMRPDVVKHAYNAAFEWYCLGRYFELHKTTGALELWLRQWRCTMLHGLYVGYPGSLDATGRALGLPEDLRKMAAGKALIRYFCTPCKPTKANGGRTRNLPHHDPGRWDLFKEYNAQDVVTEMEIERRLSRFPVPADVQAQWELDLTINLRGVAVDMDLVHGALELDAAGREELTAEAKEITGLDNPNSLNQVAGWLRKETGDDVPKLTKEAVADMLERADLPGDARRVLEIRQELGKTSNKKYNALDVAVCADGRVRGLLQFYGANRTGRWCLAEGSLIRVKTPAGDVTEKPIERVSVDDLVWDGCEWVHHDGVVYSGEKDVIYWDGVTATPEHMVWVSEDKKVPLGYAKENGLKLWAGRNGEEPKREKRVDAKRVRTYDILNAGPRNRFMADGRIVSNSGRHVQPQNLPRTYIDGELLPLARDLVKRRDAAGLRLVYGGSGADTLSQLIRTAFCASPGALLVDADFSAIEARMIAWLAGEEWVLDVFRTHGKIYEAAAAQMFGVPFENIRKGRPEYAYRQKGKVATLALGYQGGTGALTNMGALRMGIPEDDLPDIVDRWRQANNKIVEFWWALDAASKHTVQTGQPVELPGGKVAFAREIDRGNGLDFLTIRLPSGRKLYYAQPHMGQDRFGRPSICYMGLNQSTKKWEPLETYGGKLAENITQAVARDCLAEAIDRLEAEGYRVVFHIHDEVVIDRPGATDADLDRVIEIMSVVPDWAAGLPLAADGWVNAFFKKD